MTTQESLNPATATASRARSATVEKTHTQVVLDRSTLDMDILYTRGGDGVLSLALEPQLNPPANFFGTLCKLQMEVAT